MAHYRAGASSPAHSDHRSGRQVALRDCCRGSPARRRPAGPGGAALPFRRHRDLVLTTTLQPCLQCAGAIRLGPIGTVRFAGRDRYWDGYHDFGKLSAREAQRTQPARIGPRPDELGTFATLISRFGPTLTYRFEQALRTLGEGPMIDLVHALEDGGEAERLAAMEVDEALGYLWPRLRELSEVMGP